MSILHSFSTAFHNLFLNHSLLADIGSESPGEYKFSQAPVIDYDITVNKSKADD